MKRNTARQGKRKYPFIGFRPELSWEKRVRSLAKIKRVKISQVVRSCVIHYLPELERGSQCPVCSRPEPEYTHD